MNVINEKNRIIALEQKWAKAHLNMDLDTIAEIADEDYRHIKPDGTVTGKKELLDSYGSGNRKWEIAESTDHEIKISDSMAVVIAKWRGKGVNNGTVFDYQARFLAVYIKRGDDWKLLSDASVDIK